MTTIFRGEDKFAAFANLAVVVLLTDFALKAHSNIVTYICSYMRSNLSPLVRHCSAGGRAWSHVGKCGVCAGPRQLGHVPLGLG